MVLSSEILFLLVSAQGLFMLEGNTDRRVTASGERRPGVEGPFALHIVSLRQPVRSFRFLIGREDQSRLFEYAVQVEKTRKAKDRKEVGSLHSTDEAG